MTKQPTLSTKARTLESLQTVLRCGQILPLVWFSTAQWQSDASSVLAQLDNTFGDQILVVRSSAMNEDSALASMAGHFTSILNVQKQLRADAIQNVIDSYQEHSNPQDVVLVQPMLEGVRMSGVVFSHDPNTGAPYRVINYDLSEDTASVTSGVNNTKTFVITPYADHAPSEFASILSLLDELQQLFPNQPLDIEFALTTSDQIPYLFQVRPLIINKEAVPLTQHAALLSRIASKVQQSQQNHPFLRGHSTVFGVMPDWNPAEIIGVRPRPLALSLYRDLVTDSIWAYQRHNYGYRNLRSFPLLVHFAGQPYIDVRLSFNSFIPKDIDNKMADRLTNYYINRLIENPTLHDKIEFEIVFSCYTLDLPERIKILLEYGFSQRDIEKITVSLRNLTNKIIDQEKGLWFVDAEKLIILKERREENLRSTLDPVARIYWLLEDCKRYGTLPFAGLARAGFIAVQMLKSLVAINVLSQNDYDSFMNGLNTVSGQFKQDLGNLDRTLFLEKYGHLRPGTYDILSKRYDETPDDYLRVNKKPDVSERKKSFALSLKQMKDITTLLEEHGMSTDVVGLFDFLQAGIELREYAKFEFTKNLSLALSLFREWGQQFDFSEDDLSYANIAVVKELYTGADNPQTLLARSIEEGKQRYSETCQLWLPPLITKPEDVFAFHVPECEPNFITQLHVTAAVVSTTDKNKLEGAIVCIPSADPGFDWLFSHNISGLITAYGGVNSHMAIRANELGLPAIIGAGEILFGKWSSATRLHIDCAAKKVEILS